jgi:peptidoglycan/xylan/chitin deacetylase (PgdA/CDA1 family)
VESSTGSLPTGWVQDGWGTNTTKYTYLTNLGHTGTHSVQVQMTKYTDGDAKWHVNPIAVTPGNTYNFSDWYQSNIISHVVVDFTLNDGTDYYIELRTAPISTSTWAHYSESFQVILNTKTVTVFHMIESVGSLTVDDESLVKFTPKPLNRPIVTMTFDNGFEDNIGNAIPTLDKYGFKVTYCYSTEYVEGQPGQVAIVQAITSHGEEVCSHAVHHSDMTVEDSSTLMYELTHSQQYLESITGQPVLNFLSPFGAYNDTVVNAIKQVYRSHRTTDEGYNTPDNFDQYRLLVQNMNPSTTMAQYESYIQQAIKDKSWLILVYHRIATSSLEDFDTPYADFDPQMSYLKNSGVTVLTTNQALNEVIPQIGQ